MIALRRGAVKQGVVTVLYPIRLNCQWGGILVRSSRPSGRPDVTVLHLRVLRTISHLERCNRRLRRRIRAASAYHSDQGILAMTAQEANLLHAAQPQNKYHT